VIRISIIYLIVFSARVPVFFLWRFSFYVVVRPGSRPKNYVGFFYRFLLALSAKNRIKNVNDFRRINFFLPEIRIFVIQFCYRVI